MMRGHLRAAAALEPTGWLVPPPEPDLTPDDLRDLHRRPWYRLAAILLRAGADVVVHDPDAEAVEEYSLGTESITVLPVAALGWTITVHECVPDADDAEDE